MTGDDRHHRWKGQPEEGSLKDAKDQQLPEVLEHRDDQGTDRPQRHADDDQRLATIEPIGEAAGKDLDQRHRQAGQAE